MRKTVLAVLAAVLLLSLTACGQKELPASSNTSSTSSSTKTTEEVEAEHSTTAATTTTKDSGTQPTETTVQDEKAEEAEWRQFIQEYDEWVDDYIAILKKYKDNPTDMSILSDYTEMMNDLAKWAERADKIELELQDTEAALEYSAALLKIADKLAKAVY